MSKILTIDCGGSKCALTIWQSSCAALPQELATLTVPTDFADEQGLLPHLQQLCQGHQIEAAALAVAGVTNGEGRVQLTNNSCCLDLANLSLGLREIKHWTMLNDLAAFAHALPALHKMPPEQIELINTEASAEYGLQGVCMAAAVGTGLGVAVRMGSGRVLSTEAGHCSFAPESPAQVKLWQNMRRFIERPCNEDLLSGRGLVNILRACFIDGQAELANITAELSPADVSAIARGEKSAAPELTAACRQTFQLFSEAAGQALSNLALCYFSSGGIYIGGGVIAKIGELFDRAVFYQSFLKDCPFQKQLAQIPIYLIKAENTVSLGAACFVENYLLG